jgi:hypothetical protein
LRKDLFQKPGLDTQAPCGSWLAEKLKDHWKPDCKIRGQDLMVCLALMSKPDLKMISDDDGSSSRVENDSPPPFEENSSCWKNNDHRSHRDQLS